MGAVGIIKNYRQLKDVDWPSFDDGDVPQWSTLDSKFHGVTMGGGGPGGGSFSMGISTGGNTLGQSGITGSRVVLAGVGNVTLSQLTDANGGTISISGGTTSFSQSVQTQNVHNLTLDGNTAGVLAQVSSGTLTLAGGSNITLSQNGNAISIIGGAGGTETQIAISGLANSETTFTSGTVNLSALGNLTLRSTTGNAFQLSVAPQSVQPETQTFVGGVAGSNLTVTSGTVQLTGSGIVTVRSSAGQRIVIDASQSVQPETQTFLGGMAASNTTYTSGTVSLVGSGDITVQSGTGQRIIISGSQSVQPETQTFVGGLAASDTTYTSGTVRLTGVGGGVTVSSNTGQRIDISVAAPVAQTVQTQNVVDVTISGNTAGAGALVSSGTMTLAGGNNITVSQNGNAITISGANVGGAQTGISGIANSETTFTSGTVKLSELGAITIRSTTGNQFQLSVAAQTAESQSIGMSNIGNTSGTTGIASGAQVRMLFAGGNNVTLSQSLNGASGTITISAAAQTNQAGSLFAVGNTTSSSSGTYDARTLSLRGDGIISIAATNSGFRISASQSVQTQNLVDVTLSGNTSGVQALISSGTLTLAGGNNITVSQNGNAVTISGPNVGGAQTGISGIIASDATYTSGTVEMTGSGIVTIRSSAGQRVVVDASQSAQSLGAYALGNTTGQSSSTTLDARTVSIRGDGIVSVGYSGGSLRISASQSVQAETQTFVGGLANSQTTYTSGTIGLSELGAITIRSTTGNQFQLSVNAQSVQPETQTFVGGIIASDTTYTSGSIRFTGVGGGVTVSSNTGQRVDISVAAPVAQTAESQSIGMSNLGNTSGTTGIASGAQVRMLFAGGNNITLSQSLNGASGTITISGPNTQAQTNQTLGMYAVQNTTGQSSSTTMDARTLSVAGDGIVSVGYSGGSLRISASQSVQAETQTFVGGLANSQTTYTSGTVGLSELGAITIRSTTGNQFQLSVNAQTGTQFSGGISGGNTSGDTGTVAGRLVLAGGNNITLSGSTNGASETITISAGAAGGFSGGVSNVGNTSGDTGITGSRLVLSGGQSITLSQSTNASGATVMISGASTSQSNQSIGMYAVQNTTGQSSSTTMDARTLSVAGDGAVSVGYSAGSLRISAPTQTVESQSIGMSNLGNTAGTTGVASGGQVRFVIVGSQNITASQSLNGASGTISLSGAPAFSAGLSNLGNTGGATGISGTRLVLVGSNNITLSQTTDASGATVSINAPSPGAAQFSVGVSNLGNTAGSTGVTGTRIVLAGTNNISLSQSTDATGATISLSGAPSFSAGVSTDGNTAGATGMTGTRMVWVGSSPISLSQTTGTAGGTITINAPQTSSLVGVSGISISTNGSTISVFPTPRTSYNPFDEAMAVTGQQGQGSLHIQPFHPPHVQYDRILLSYQFSNASNSSNSFTLSNWIGIYTRNASTLSLLSSISTSTNFSGSGTAGSYSLYGGMRHLSVPWTMTLSDGDYWIGIVTRTTTGGGAGHTLNQMLRSVFTAATLTGWSGLMGAATNATVQQMVGLGTYSVSTSGIPNSIQFSEITGTGSLPMFVPLFQLRSGTV